jgi:hypothetical protein
MTQPAPAERASRVHVLTLDAATDLSAPHTREEALAALESGGLVFLPDLGFTLTPDERDLMADTSRMLIGFDEREKRHHFALRDGRIVRARIRRAAGTTLEAMMARFSAWADDLVARLLPDYHSVVTRDRVTYRPNEREIVQPLHVDSSYGHPTQGRGMLRVFCNVDPGNRPRRWQVGEPFERFASRWIGSLRPRSAGWSEVVLDRLGLVGPKAPFDQLIADLRRAGKKDKDYQRNGPREIIEFPCGSTWIAITDLVVHGGLSGQHSLDQTFYLPASAMRDPSRSTLRILERMTGRALV